MKFILMATFLMTCQVAIGDYSFKQVHRIETRSSWKTLADTATIELPSLKNTYNIANHFKVGDKVSINMGWTGWNKVYDYNEFTGYVKRIKPNVPVVIECEDATWLLRRVPLNKVLTNCTLRDVVNYIIAQSNKVNTDQITLLSQTDTSPKFEKIVLANVNGAEALEGLKKYGIVAFFRGLQLYVGLPYIYTSGNVKYNLAFNTIDSDLTYRHADDIAIRLKAIAVNANGKTITVTVPVGKTDGDLRSKVYAEVLDKDSLIALANSDIKKLKFEGYEGELETFIVPFVQHSMAADIIDPDYEARDGRYMVDEVVTEFERGIVRKVSLGKRL